MALGIILEPDPPKPCPIKRFLKSMVRHNQTDGFDVAPKEKHEVLAEIYNGPLNPTARPHCKTTLHKQLRFCSQALETSHENLQWTLEPNCTQNFDFIPQL